MQVGPGRHAELAAELAEWQEDLCQRHTGSRVVLVKVPSRWGRTTVLDRFQAQIEAREDAPVTLTIRMSGRDLPGETSFQAQALQDLLAPAIDRYRVAELLGLDRPAGAAQLGLGVGALFASGLTAGISFLLAGLAVGAAGKAWDGSLAGQDGALARAARAVAAVSVSVPVVVIVDDADCLDVSLAVALVENLTARHDGQVLIIAAMDPGSALAGALPAELRQGVTGGLVHSAEADPDMGYESRLELARRLCPGLPDAGARRIAQRTATFTEVFAVAAVPGLADLDPGSAPDKVVALVDAAAGARLARPAPSPEATVIAWAGGMVHARQAVRALSILSAPRKDDDPDVRRWESLERLTDPAAPRWAEQVAVGLAAGARRALAAAFLGEALALTADPSATLIDKVAALRAVHRVRGDLPAPGQLPRVQRELVAALEALGDAAAALQVASEALAGWPPGDLEFRAEHDALTVAVIRLSRAVPRAAPGPLAEQLIAEAAAGGAAAGLEARIWAAVVLLDTPGQREAALALAGQAAADLDAASGLGTAGDRWRLLLAYHAGRAGRADLSGRLLAPLTTSSDPARQDAAAMVRRVTGGPDADIRLQNIWLEAELNSLPADAEDERLRLYQALAANHATLGDYRQALAYGQHDLDLRARIQGPRYPDALTARVNVADWTGEAGDAAAARDLFAALLPDLVQVLGPEHPGTLAARGGLARWTGEAGDPAGARDQLAALLPVLERVLGPEHPDTLTTRGGLARWTGEAGDAAGTRDQLAALLPVLERVLGPEHPGTLNARHNLAYSTGKAGDAAGARDQLAALLPIRERIPGPEHPDTLATRDGLARWTGEAGDPAGARDQFAALLPIRERVLGPEHPDTLVTRGSLARWTGNAGDAAGTRDQLAALLPVLERVLGPEHPGTLNARHNLAYSTGKAGDAAGARDQLAALLPIRERIPGPEHPDTLATRDGLARWTGEAGDPAGARDQLAALLPIQERVLGPEHPGTLAARGGLARWTGEAGDPAGTRDQLAALLPVLERVLGPEHPGTLAARGGLARWTGEAGDPAAARDQLAALLPVLERVLGPEHPDSLGTRRSLGYWTGQAGDDPSAV